ncbi:sulfotransferase [Hyphococcus flavus]|uniref:Sulfotransferase n=1 Tax=Hyphococcus flavus TaxID=1866326 RepID=A0AAE9ZGC7_9PROT|nr:sulfotransferase [Hyphococcus flavus]WDI32448.1 sulfotransferase [Hyphococcus flavus]
MASLQTISDLLSQEQLEAASAALRKLVKQKNQPDVDWPTAVDIAGRLADQETALIAAQNWRAEAPNDPQRIITEIISLGSAARHKEAAKLARELQKFPQAAADGYSLEGFYQARFGEREKALELCRKAVELNPDHSHAWEQIALLDGYDDVNNDIAEMLALEKRVTEPQRLMALYFALGRAFDYAGDTDNAFLYFSKGADFRKGPNPFDMRPVHAYLEGLKATFNSAFLDQHAHGDAGQEVVFILSAPRSGSTLIEQILSTAPSVTPTGEHMLLRRAALPFGGLTPPEMAKAAEYTQNDWRKISRNHLESLRKRFGPGKIYTDKSLINHYYAGLVKVLYPNARFIWMRRDPRDVAWSCYHSRLNGNPWTESIESACEFLTAHNNICSYWSELLGDNLLAVDYEDLVASPEETSAKIFQHVGIDRPDDWRDFYKSDNPVATASLAQVREPLNKKGVGSWRRYEKHLAPIYDKCFA